MNGAPGYVYILEVKDIVLPVCKIGRTTRDPDQRCAEINSGSTGDFLWEVATTFYVNDCARLETLVHNKLGPLRQKRREFFNLSADDADSAIRSILNEVSDITEQKPAPQDARVSGKGEATQKRRPNRRQFRKEDSRFTELLLTFTEMLGVRGRPFGQLNRSVFGVSDGHRGVQWNLAIDTDPVAARLGVNLEGVAYDNWPIATFILSELEHPSIDDVRSLTTDASQITLRFRRDAWQAASRPVILEEYIGGKEISLDDLSDAQWQALLAEALTCLDSERDYRGRNRQVVTYAAQPKQGARKRKLSVSPHLLFWTTITLDRDPQQELRTGLNRLRPVYNWVCERSQQIRE